MRTAIYVLGLLAILLTFSQFSPSDINEPHASAPIEDCSNGIDDDGDGLIDLNDTSDCACVGYDLIPSIIPNPSFEDTLCCPRSLSQMDCASVWIQATRATVDYFNVGSPCNFGGTLNRGFPPTPLPDGFGYVGFINSDDFHEYVGACLLGTMEKDSSFTMQFDFGFGLPGVLWEPLPSTEVAFFGSSSCARLPVNTTDCPDGFFDWVELGRTTVSGVNEWVQGDISFNAPFDINAVMIGGVCEDQGANREYYFIDNLILNRSRAFVIDQNPTITLKANCSIQDTLCVDSADFSLNTKFQWYKDGIALANATQFNYILLSADSANYQVRIQTDSGCLLSVLYNYVPTILDSILVDTIICAGDALFIQNVSITESGQYSFLLNEPFCDSLLILGVTVQSAFDTLVFDSICEGEIVDFEGRTFTETGIYPFSYVSVNNCDSSWTLNLTVYPKYDDVIFDTICAGARYLFGGEEYTETGMFEFFGPTINGCDSMIELNLLVLGDQSIRVDILNEISCDQVEDGALLLNPLPPLEASILWNNGETTALIDSLSAGDYSVTVDYGFNCSYVANYTLEAADPLQSDLTIVDIQCADISAGGTLLLDTLFGGTPPYTFELDGVMIELEMDVRVDAIAAGEHQFIAYDKNLCSFTFDFTIEDPSATKSIELVASSFNVGVGQTVELTVELFNISEPYTIQWSGLSTDCPACLTQEVFPSSGSNIYQVDITDSVGCVFPAEVQIEASLNYYIPNVFSPNNDGINDVFIILTDEGISSINTLKIYNRWGGLVFSRQNFEPNSTTLGWSGLINNTEASPGLYVYTAELVDGLGNMIQEKGEVLLVR